MTLGRFQELWSQQLGAIVTELDCAPETEAALIAASSGDFSYFDRIDAILKQHDHDTIIRSSRV